jgi:hypothetical protein
MVARIERSEIRGRRLPRFASLNAGYELLSMRARERGAFWPNEPNCDFGQTNPMCLTPVVFKRGPIITGRGSWIPALHPLRGRRPGRRSGGATDQPAAVRNERRLGLPLSGLFFTGNAATATCHDVESRAALAFSHDMIELMEDRGEVVGLLSDPAAVDLSGSNRNRIRCSVIWILPPARPS